MTEYITRRTLLNRSKVEWTDYTKGWIEATIDCEGSLLLIKEVRPHFRDGCTYKPKVSIGNNCVPLLEYAKQIVGFGNIQPPTKSRSTYQFECYSKALRKLLPKITLIVKEKQRLLLLEALAILEKRRRGRYYGSKRLSEIYIEIRDLNGRWKN